MMRAALFLAAAFTLAGQADRTLTVDAVPGSFKFSSDGKALTARTNDNHIRTWDVATGKLTGDKKVAPGTVLLSSQHYAERGEDKSIRVWDLTAERQLYLLSGASMNRAVTSRDGKHFASAPNADRTIRIWDTATGKERHVLADGLGGPAALAFSPDGETLVSANYDNDIRVWKTKSGELIRKMEDMTGAMFAAEFTPDGKQLVMAGLDETVYVWDAKTFQPVKKLQGHGETISALAISPDGRTIVTGGFDVITVKNPVNVVFWDAASGKVLRTVKSPHRVVALAFSPDGKWVAMTSGEKEISLWKVPTASSL